MPLIRKGADPVTPAPVPDFERARAELLSDAADARWRAARALADFANAGPALGDALAAERDGQVREALFTSLARIGTAQSVQILTPYIRSDDAALRTGAMDALKAMPSVLPAALASLLNDADADVRVLACDLARELPAAEATALLAAVLDAETEVNVCAAAVDVIADIGSPDALPPLRRCAARFAGDPFLAFAIQIACDRIGTQGPPNG